MTFAHHERTQNDASLWGICCTRGPCGVSGTRGTRAVLRTLVALMALVEHGFLRALVVLGTSVFSLVQVYRFAWSGVSKSRMQNSGHERGHRTSGGCRGKSTRDDKVAK